MKKALIAMISLYLLAPQVVSAERDPLDLRGKRVVLIIAERLWHTHEYTYLKDLLEMKGAETAVACTAIRKISRSGLTVKPDLLVKDINVDDFNAIIFIGGAGCMQYVDDDAAHAVIKKAVAQNIILGALQMAPYIFDQAGIIGGKRVTAFNPHNIKSGTAIVTRNKVERDGNIVTASMGSGVIEEFGNAIVEALSEQSK